MNVTVEHERPLQFPAPYVTQFDFAADYFLVLAANCYPACYHERQQKPKRIGPSFLGAGE